MIVGDIKGKSPSSLSFAKVLSSAHKINFQKTIFGKVMNSKFICQVSSVCSKVMEYIDNEFDLPFHIFMPVHSLLGQPNLVEVMVIFSRSRVNFGF